MAKKRISVANFNVVFYEGEKERALLEYFDKLVMPVFTSGIVKKAGDATYRLMNINVCKKDDDYILTGLIVKKTILEVKSDLTSDGTLIKLDEKYPTAPFSTFIIYLKNHRMLYAENQKGSPNLKSFRSTIQYMFNTFIKSTKKSEEIDIIPIVNIVGIPSRSRLKDTLKDVEKIEKLTLRFYPLNGDLDITGMFEGLSSDLRKLVGSKNGEIMFRSPGNVNGILDVVEKAEGTVEPIFEVRYPGKHKVTIRSDLMSERMEMDIQGENVQEEIEELVNKGREIKNLSYVSSGNKELYEKNLQKIRSFCDK